MRFFLHRKLPAATDISKWPFEAINFNTLCNLNKESFNSLDSNTNTNSCLSLLRECTDLKSLNELHAILVVSGLQQDGLLGTKLVNMYTKFGTVEDAREVFDEMPERNIYSWNAILRGYARKGFSGETLELYNQMQEEGVQPDNFTFPSVLKACRSISAGKEIHHHIAKAGYELDIFVGTGLVDMYGKCGSIEDARQIFDKMPERDAVMYTAMIAAYTQNGDSRQALALFNQMQAEGLAPDLFTVVSALQACADLGAIEQGKWVHDYIIRKGYELDIFVVTALVDMYAKCRRLDIARHLFDNMRRPNGVLWTAIISAHAQNGDADEALGLFHRMQFAGWKPDSVTVMSLLQACARAGDLIQGV